MADLADVDPVAFARAWLLESERLTDALGGGDRLRARNTPPYPMIRLTDPPGNDRTLRHLIAPVVQIEALGDPDGSPGKPALRRILYIALAELERLPERPVRAADKAVCTMVESTGGGGFVPLPPSDQPRYIATVRMYMHPLPDPVAP